MPRKGDPSQIDRELEESAESSSGDRQLTFIPPEILESLHNKGALNDPPGDFRPRKGFDHLKNVYIDLNKLDLTDKQLIAVCLVFYGGAKKSRAARAMKITGQALADHIKGGLKKIAHNLY